jgi:putative hemolysin
MRKILMVATVAFLALGLAACRGPKNNNPVGPGMANPASVYCEDNGGTLEIRTGADGGEYGVCMFDDGSECDEWAYFRGECAPGEQMEVPAP